MNELREISKDLEERIAFISKMLVQITKKGVESKIHSNEKGIITYVKIEVLK